MRPVIPAKTKRGESTLYAHPVLFHSLFLMEKKMEAKNYDGKSASHISEGRQSIESTKLAIRNSGQKIKDGVSELAHEAKESINIGNQFAKDSLEEGFAQAKSYSSQSVKQMRVFFMKKPFQSLGVAIGAGVLLGYLMHPSRRAS